VIKRERGASQQLFSAKTDPIRRYAACRGLRALDSRGTRRLPELTQYPASIARQGVRRPRRSTPARVRCLTEVDVPKPHGRALSRRYAPAHLQVKVTGARLPCRNALYFVGGLAPSSWMPITKALQSAHHGRDSAPLSKSCRVSIPAMGCAESRRLSLDDGRKLHARKLP